MNPRFDKAVEYRGYKLVPTLIDPVSHLYTDAFKAMQTRDLTPGSYIVHDQAGSSTHYATETDAEVAAMRLAIQWVNARVD